MGRTLKVMIGLVLFWPAFFALLLWLGFCSAALQDIGGRPQLSDRSIQKQSQAKRSEYKQQPHQRATQKFPPPGDAMDPTRPYLHHAPPAKMFPPADQPALASR
jgi:hypothetical protein